MFVPKSINNPWLSSVSECQKWSLIGKLEIRSPIKFQDLCERVLWVAHPVTPLPVRVRWHLGWPVSWRPPTSSTRLFSLFCLFPPTPLDCALLKAGPTRRVNAPRGNSQPLGDESLGINTPVSQSFGGKILTFAPHGVSRVLNGLRSNRSQQSLPLAHPLLPSPSSLFCFLKSTLSKMAIPKFLS